MSEVRLFAKNSLALTTGSISVALLGAVYRVYIARYLGEVEFGKYLFIFTLVGYCSVLSLLGLRNVVIREVAKAPAQYRFILRGAFRIRLFTTTSAFLLLCLVMLVLNKGSDVNIGLMICGLSLFPMAAVDILESMFIAAQSSVYVTITNITGNTLKIAIGIYLLTQGFGLLAILTLLLGVWVFNSLMDWFFFRRLFRNTQPAENPCAPSIGRFMLTQSLPFFYIMLLSRVYYKNDVLVLSLLKGDEIVGGYGAAYMAVDFLLLTAGSINAAAYPVMSRTFSESPEKLARLQALLSRYLMMVFLLPAVILTIAGPEIVELVFGERYTGYGPALRIIAWIPPAEAVTVAMGMLLGATYRQTLSAKVALLAAVLCLCFNLALIPKYSYMGAAIGTVVAVYINMIVAIYAVHRFVVKLPVLDSIVRPVLTAAATLIVAYLIGTSAGKWMTLSLAAPVYLLLLVLTRSVTHDDYKFLKATFLRKAATSVG